MIVAALLALPGTAMAQYGDEEEDIIRDADGRLRGYAESGVVLEESSTFLTYATLAGLSIVAAGIMFKSSRRTHLD